LLPRGQPNHWPLCAVIGSYGGPFADRQKSEAILGERWSSLAEGASKIAKKRQICFRKRGPAKQNAMTRLEQKDIVHKTL
jgi:hypothetical protein